MLALEITAKPETLPVAHPSRFNGGNNPWKSSDTSGDFALNLVVFRIKDENLIENENIHEILFKRYGSFESL